MTTRVIVAIYLVLFVILGVAGQKAARTTTTTTTNPPKKDGWDQPMKYIGTLTESPAPGLPNAAIVNPSACSPLKCPARTKCPSGAIQIVVDPNSGCQVCQCTPLSCPPYDSAACASGANCNGQVGTPTVTGGCSYCICPTSPATTTKAPTQPATTSLPSTTGAPSAPVTTQPPTTPQSAATTTAQPGSSPTPQPGQTTPQAEATTTPQPGSSSTFQSGQTTTVTPSGTGPVTSSTTQPGQTTPQSGTTTTTQSPAGSTPQSGTTTTVVPTSQSTGVPSTSSTQPGETTTPQSGATTTPQPGQSTGVPSTSSTQPGETTTPQSGQTTTPQSGATTTPQPGQSTGVPSTSSTQPGETTTPQSGTTTIVPTLPGQSTQPGDTTTPQSGATTTPQPGQSTDVPSTSSTQHGDTTTIVPTLPGTSTQPGQSTGVPSTSSTQPGDTTTPHSGLTTPQSVVTTTVQPGSSTTPQSGTTTTLQPGQTTSTVPGTPTTTEQGTTTFVPTTTCAPVDCDAKCPTTTWRKEICDQTSCPKCVCEPSLCPILDCDASCPGTTWSQVKCEHNECLECRCDKRDTCSTVDCKAECPNGSYSVFQDEDGCPDCNCSPTCPTCDVNECKKECGDSFKVVKGYSGCDECLCTANNKEPCRDCECQTKVDVKVNLVRYMTKRAYVPYTVHYDAVTGSSNNVSVVEQYNYVVTLKKSVSVYRHALVSLRSVLRKLVLSGRITKEVFDKADEAARRRKAALELDVLKSRLTLAELERRLKKVNALIKSLGYERHCPGVCLFIGEKRVCDLHPNYVVTKQATYLKNNIFTKEIYTKVATSVSEIKRDLSTQTVQYVRKAPTWRKSVVKTNSVVRTAVWDQVFIELLTDSKISQYVNRFFELKKETVDFAKLSAAQSKTVKKILLRRFKRTTVRSIRQAMKSDKIKALQLQNKPEVVAPVDLPTRVTREIVRLPAEVLRQQEEYIAILLVGRHSVESL